MPKYIPDYKSVHPKFKLNGFQLSANDLYSDASSFIKEGADFEKDVGVFMLDWFDATTFVEMKTSGSTGKPKTIRVSKQAMIQSALATGAFFNLEPGNTILNCLPLKYVAGKMMVVRAFVLGLELDLIAPRSNPLEHIKKTYDFIALVPLQVQNSLDYLHNFKTVIIGGAKVSSDLEQKLKAINSDVFETFGMTETITHIAARKIGEKAFTALPNVVISTNTNRCLLIDAPNISDQVIHTNDLVELVYENQFIFLGRFDNIINSGGVKLIPEQIEEKLRPFINRRFFVYGKSNELLGQQVVLVVEGEVMPIEFDEIKNLNKIEHPKEIVFIPQFKETPNGKVIRKETVLGLSF
ncbi:AMP-binding protein [uncultured Flavobacterium sp.]|uniref:AMP-binding protein n=1 Tax=uncultured Flavobacterium sp. TaxID=165435 RepID=UPI0030CA57AF|tara:strand:+ start:48 stop:1106 length:1059 start_codon:yes stop_codon:yes gene_type:complete